MCCRSQRFNVHPVVIGLYCQSDMTFNNLGRVSVRDGLSRSMWPVVISVKVCLGCVSFIDLLPTMGGTIPQEGELGCVV